MKQVNLVLGTMTFGESVFSPDVSTFVNTFWMQAMKNWTLPTSITTGTVNACWGKRFPHWIVRTGSPQRSIRGFPEDWIRKRRTGR